MATQTDLAILEKLKSDDSRAQNEALKYLYQNEKNATVAYVKRYGGTAADANDVFQDALVVLYTKVRKNDLVLHATLHTYLQSVSRNVWKKKLRDRKPTQDLDKLDNTPFDASQIKALEASEKTQALAGYIRKLGSECQRLLILFYYERTRMKQIAKLMQLSGEAVAKNRKARCMKHLKKLTANDKLFKELLSN